MPFPSEIPWFVFLQTEIHGDSRSFSQYIRTYLYPTDIILAQDLEKEVALEDSLPSISWEGTPGTISFLFYSVLCSSFLSSSFSSSCCVLSSLFQKNIEMPVNLPVWFVFYIVILVWGALIPGPQKSELPTACCFLNLSALLGAACCLFFCFMLAPVFAMIVFTTHALGIQVV